MSSYQDGPPEGTVEAELRRGLVEAEVALEERAVTARAEAIEAHHGAVSVVDVLPQG